MVYVVGRGTARRSGGSSSGFPPRRLLSDFGPTLVHKGREILLGAQASGEVRGLVLGALRVASPYQIAPATEAVVDVTHWTAVRLKNEIGKTGLEVRLLTTAEALELPQTFWSDLGARGISAFHTYSGDVVSFLDGKTRVVDDGVPSSGIGIVLCHERRDAVMY